MTGGDDNVGGESGGEQQTPASSGTGVGDWAAAQYRRLREHAEEYPYVWASYILVYGGLGAYLTWRWRKLRRTEDRVRVLQQRLRDLVDAEEKAAASNDGPASTSASERSRHSTSASPPPTKPR